MSFKRLFGFGKANKRSAVNIKSYLKDCSFFVFGLGNIGPKHAHTRHNAGFDVLDIILKEYPAAGQEAFMGEIFPFEYEGVSAALIKPSTYMNLSGKCVKAIMDKYRVKPEKIIIISDDIDLPLGKIRIRQGGSAGNSQWPSFCYS